MHIDYKELCKIRKQLIRTIHESLLSNERDFLISLKSGDPQWDLMPISHLCELPSIRWKVLNIQKMDKTARLMALQKLKVILNNEPDKKILTIIGAGHSQDVFNLVKEKA